MKTASQLAPLALLALSSLALADGRDPLQLQPSTNGSGPILASAEDITAVLLVDSLVEQLTLRVSDGRGLAWGSNLLVDAPGSADFISFRKAAIHAGSIFVAWADDRNYQPPLWPLVASTPFLRVYDAQSGTATGELQVPTGTPPQNTSSHAYDLAVTEVAGAVHVHVASYQRLLSPISGAIEIQVFLYSSHDGGLTWLAPLPITAPNEATYGEIQVLAAGNDVHVLWTHAPGYQLNQIYHQRSSDGGQTLDFVTASQVPNATQVNSWDADLDGSLLAIAWENFASDFLFSWSEVVTSLDRGDSYQAQGSFGSIALPVDQAFDPRVAISPGTGDVTAVAAAIDFDGNGLIVTTHSSTSGQAWDPSQLVHFGTSKRPEVVAAGPGRDRVAVTWLDGFGLTGPIHAATSLDRGASFGPELVVATIATSSHQVVWNDHYQNLMTSFVEWAAPKAGFIGGYRPQAITPTGFVAGSTSIAAGFEGFDGGADLGWLLLSTTTTALPLPLGDGRLLGIGDSPLFTAWLPLALGGVGSTPLAADGSGASGPIPVPAPGVPSGLTVQAVGLSFDLSTGGFVDISDVVTLDT